MLAKDSSEIDPAGGTSCRVVPLSDARRPREAATPGTAATESRLREEKDRSEFFAESLRMKPQMARLSPDALEALIRKARIMRFADNALILARGEEMRLAGAVLCGGLRSSVTGYDGHEMSISVLRRGSFYGWVGLMAPTPSPWDMYAHGPTELLAIQITDFRRAMRDHTELNAIVAEGLSAKLRKAFDHMHILNLDGPEERLRRILVMLAGDRDMFAKGTVPRIKMTQEALGSFIRCSRPTVNKLLRDMERAGLIQLAYGEIVIPDLAALYPPESLERFHLR